MLSYLAAALASAGVAKFVLDVLELSRPEEYVDLATAETRREHRPLSDVVAHVVVFRWARRALGDGRLFQRVLARLNAEFLEWDTPFAARGLDAETEARAKKKTGPTKIGRPRRSPRRSRLTIPRAPSTRDSGTQVLRQVEGAAR